MIMLSNISFIGKMSCLISVSFNNSLSLFSNTFGKVDQGIHVHFMTENLKCDSKSIVNSTRNLKSPMLLVDGNYVSKNTVYSAPR